jgi:hypothetical protein
MDQNWARHIVVYHSESYVGAMALSSRKPKSISEVLTLQGKDTILNKPFHSLPKPPVINAVMSMSWVGQLRAASGLENSFGKFMLRFEVRYRTGIVNKYQCTLVGSQQALLSLPL